MDTNTQLALTRSLNKSHKMHFYFFLKAEFVYIALLYIYFTWPERYVLYILVYLFCIYLMPFVILCACFVFVTLFSLPWRSIWCIGLPHEDNWLLLCNHSDYKCEIQTPCTRGQMLIPVHCTGVVNVLYLCRRHAVRGAENSDVGGCCSSRILSSAAIFLCY